MKYKLINTGNTDQHIPVKHGEKKHGVVGSSGSLPGKLVIPGLAKVKDGDNNIIITEETLRSVFGLFEKIKPGVINREKPSKISPDNVKYNTRILDSGRIIVTDEFGNHVFGVGGTAYQKSALDSVKTENEMLKDKLENLVQVLVNDGYTEEQARDVISGKGAHTESVLKQKEIGIRSTGMDLNDSGPSTLDVAKEVFKDRETVTVFAGDDVVKDYKVKSMDAAIKKISKLAGDAETPISFDDAGLPWFQDAEGRVVRLG